MSKYVKLEDCVNIAINLYPHDKEVKRQIQSLPSIDEEWVSVVDSGQLPKTDVWYQCAKYSRQLDEYAVLLLPYQYYKGKGFMAYTESHFDNTVTHWRKLPQPPTK